MRFRPKIIEERDGYKLIAFPFWATEEMLRRAAQNARKDAAVRGRKLTITVGHRLMRVEDKNATSSPGRSEDR